MADTIETFVAKLQSEGVEAGKAQAETILADAEQQAQKIVADAHAKAEKIVADAHAEGEGLLERSRTELQLAARDTMLRLRDSLNQSLSAVLARGTREQLADVAFMQELIREVVMAYAKADLEGKRRFELRVQDEMKDKLAEYVHTQIAPDAQKNELPVEVADSLHAAGFEYEVTGATVEITQDSIVETLKQLVAPRLREVLDKATTQQD